MAATETKCNIQYFFTVLVYIILDVRFQKKFRIFKNFFDFFYFYENKSVYTVKFYFKTLVFFGDTVLYAYIKFILEEFFIALTNR